MIDQNLIAFIYTEYKGETLYYRKDHISQWVPFDYNIVTAFTSLEEAYKEIDEIRLNNDRDDFDMNIKYTNIEESSLKELVGGKIMLVETQTRIGDMVGITT